MDLSIHPRNWPTGDGKKVNTAKPHKGGGKLAKKQSALARRRLAHSKTIEPLSSSHGFKTPGSMNQHKGSPAGRKNK